MEQGILIFWIAVYAFVWLLRRDPQHIVTRAAFAWIGPRPIVGEPWASFQLRWASYSFGWLCQFAVVLSALFVLASYFPSAGEAAWFQGALLGLALGVGIAVLAMLGFLVTAGKAHWLGPNPTWPEAPSIENGPDPS